MTHNGLGQVLRDQKKDLGSAERVFHLCYDAAAAEIPPNKEQMVQALVGLAGVCYARSQPVQSLQYVEQALAMDPSEGNAHVAKAVDLLALGRLNEAQQTFEQAYCTIPTTKS